MGLDLNTALISDTFDGLIKTQDGNVLTDSPLPIGDGRGNDSSLAIATAGNGVTITGTLLVDGANIGTGLSTAQADITAIETKTDFITITGAVNLDTIKTKSDYISVTQAVDLDAMETKTNFITITQAVNLDTVESNAAAAKAKTDYLTVTQAVDLDTLESDMVVAKADITAIEAKTDYITISSNLNLNTVASNASSAKTKTDFITITQAVDLDTVESDLSQAQTDINLIEAKTNNITVTQAVNLDTMESDIATNNAKNSYPAADATKVGFISVTQAVDLDSMETDISNLSSNKYDKTGGTISGNVTVTGDLTVNGTTTTVNTQTLSVEDPLIELANQNSANSVDTGFYANYSLDAGVTTKYAGLFKDAGDSDKFKLFKGLEVEPTTTVNTAGTGYTKGDLVVGDLDAVTISGNLTGNVSGNLTGTVLTAAQTNITSVGTLSSLAVGGDINVSNTSGAYLSIDTDSAAANAGIRLSESSTPTTNGAELVYDGSTNKFHIKTGAASFTERLTIERDNGNVGIGTSSPAKELEVYGDAPTIRISGNGLSGGNNFGSLEFYNYDGSSDGPNVAAAVRALARNANGSGGHLTFETSVGNAGEGVPATEKMRIDGEGNVGINTDNPQQLLQVTGNPAMFRLECSDTTLDVNQVLGGVEVYSNDANGVGVGVKTSIKTISENTSGSLIGMAFSTTENTGSNEVERMRIDAYGNVGIGTSSPLAKTHIKSGDSGFAGSLGTNYDDLAVEGSGNTGITILTPNNNNAGIAFADEDSELQGLILYSHGSDFMAFRTAAQERLRIDSSGNLGLGTSSPDTLLHLAKNIEPELKFEATDIGVDAGQSLGTISWYANDSSAGGVGERAFISSVAENAGTQYSLIFGTGSGVDATEKMRLADDGYLRLAGAGIQFNGDTDSSNALDDYEEGNFDPIIADAASGGNEATTFSTYASYTKVGRLCTLTMAFTNIDTTGLTAGNNIFITGLPFEMGNISGTQFAIGNVEPSALTFSGNVSLRLQDSTQYIRIYNSVSGTNAVPLDIADITSGTCDLRMTITYHTTT